jgi:hypothetical protein
MFSKSYVHKRCGTLRKTSNSIREYAEFRYKGWFLTTKKHIKNSCIENPNSGHML